MVLGCGRLNVVEFREEAQESHQQMTGAQLKNKWILITGASSGFGAAAARASAREGAKLLLGARRIERLEQVAAEARKAGAAEAHVHALDVPDLQRERLRRLGARENRHTGRAD